MPGGAPCPVGARRDAKNGLPCGLPCGLPDGLPDGFPSGLPTRLPTGFSAGIATGLPVRFPAAPPKVTQSILNAFPACGSLAQRGRCGRSARGNGSRAVLAGERPRRANAVQREVKREDSRAARRWKEKQGNDKEDAGIFNARAMLLVPQGQAISRKIKVFPGVFPGSFSCGRPRELSPVHSETVCRGTAQQGNAGGASGRGWPVERLCRQTKVV